MNNYVSLEQFQALEEKIRVLEATFAKYVFPGPEDPIVLIQKIVARVCGVSFQIFSSKLKPDKISQPRIIAMALCVERELWSTNTIGSYFGNREHTTVLHAAKKIKILHPNDPWFPFLQKCRQEVEAAFSKIP